MISFMPPQRAGWSRIIVIGYSWLAYGTFVASLAWAIAFLADLPAPAP
jgi:hypothetical protein